MPLPSDRGADAASLPPAAGPSRRAGRQRHLVAAGGEPSSRFAAGAWRGGASAPAPPSPRETPSSGARPSPPGAPPPPGRLMSLKRGSVEPWGWRRALGLAAAPRYSPNPPPPSVPSLRTGSPGVLLGRCGSVPTRGLPSFAAEGPLSVLGFVTQDAGPRARRTS